MPPGRFIVFSGGEGSGKTTVLDAMMKEFPDALRTKEPGGTPVGQAIRRILLDAHHLEPQPMTELFLFFADRAEHVATVVHPALAQGRTVMSDRYWMETYAYEWSAGMDRHDPKQFLELIQWAGFPAPDLWLWFDIDPAVGLQRRQATGQVDRIDAKALSYHERVRTGFRDLYESRLLFPAVRIDASQPVAKVIADVQATIMQHEHASAA